MAESCFGVDDDQAGFDAIEHVLELDPGNFDALALGLSRSREIEDLARLELYVERIIDRQYLLLESVVDLVSSSLLVLNQPERALDVANAALSRSPENIRLILTKVRCLCALDKSEEAVDSAIHAVMIVPGYAAAHFLLGEVMRLQGERVKAMLAYLMSVVLTSDEEECKTAMLGFYSALSHEPYEWGGVRLFPKADPGTETERVATTSDPTFVSSDYVVSELYARHLYEIIQREDTPDRNADLYDDAVILRHDELETILTALFKQITNDVKHYEGQSFWWTLYAPFYALVYLYKFTSVYAMAAMRCFPNNGLHEDMIRYQETYYAFWRFVRESPLPISMERIYEIDDTPYYETRSDGVGALYQLQREIPKFDVKLILLICLLAIFLIVSLSEMWNGD